MASDLIPTRSNRPSRDLVRRIETTNGDGIIAAARVQAGAYVTSVALHHATRLSVTANNAFRLSPMGEDIYQTILNSFGSLAAVEIQALGLQNRTRV